MNNLSQKKELIYNSGFNPCNNININIDTFLLQSNEEVIEDFKRYLIETQKEENLLFLIEVKKIKRGFYELHKKSHEIFETYLSTKGKNQINIDSSSINSASEKLSSISLSSFDFFEDANNDIRNILNETILPSYINLERYKNNKNRKQRIKNTDKSSNFNPEIIMLVNTYVRRNSEPTFFKKKKINKLISSSSSGSNSGKHYPDSITINLHSGLNEYIILARKRNLVSDLISFSEKNNLYDSLKDSKLSKYAREYPLGIWMEIKSKWLDENKNLSDYAEFFNAPQHIFELRKRSPSAN